MSNEPSTSQTPASSPQSPPPPSSSEESFIMPPSPDLSFADWWKWEPDYNTAIREWKKICTHLDRLERAAEAKKSELHKSERTLRHLRALKARNGRVIMQAHKELMMMYVRKKKRLGLERWLQFKQQLRAKKRRETAEAKRKFKQNPDLNNVQQDEPLVLGAAISFYVDVVNRLERPLASLGKEIHQLRIYEACWWRKANEAIKREKRETP